MDYTLYAALHEDIAEGFVWLPANALPARCTVRISHHNGDRRRSVYCEALQLDKNFISRYNGADGTKKIADNGVDIMVMSNWYRFRLGRLQTQKKYMLEIKACNNWCGKLLACTHHPQVIVRVGAWLGIVSVSLGVVSIMPCISKAHQALYRLFSLI